MCDEIDLTDSDIEQAGIYADSVFDSVVEDCEELELDLGTVMFNLFLTSIHVLTSIGWTNSELKNEVESHSECGLTQ
jgi:hypothetical protein